MRGLGADKVGGVGGGLYIYIYIYIYNPLTVMGGTLLLHVLGL